MQKQYERPYHSSTIPGTAPQQYEEQYRSNTVDVDLRKPSSTSHMVQNMALLSGPPHPPQLQLEERQQNMSIQYM